MSQPIVPPDRVRVSPSILRRLSRRDVSHDFDVIGDAPPPAAQPTVAQQAEQTTQEPPRAAE